MVTIQVFSKSSGSTVKGVRVSVDASSFLAYGLSKQNTDGNGYAHFGDLTPGQYTYYVDGKEFKGRLEGVTVVYI